MATILNNFHFIRPWWLLALPLGLLLLALLKRQEPGQSRWHKVCDQHLLEHLLVGEAKIERKRVYGALLTMLLLATLALAGPTWERLPQPLFRTAEGRVLVLDLSLSMMATDIAPNRLTRARYKTNDLIKSGVGMEQGLVVFAGDAFIVTPLTDDRATLLNLLPSLSCDTVPVQGSRADRGLEKALELLQRAAIHQGQIILISDDADAETVAMAEKIRQAGHRIDVIAVGTGTGAPVHLANGGYLKDNRGKIVVPVPDFTTLKEVARAGGGSYLTIASGNRAWQQLNQFPTQFPKNREAGKLKGDQWLDRGPWLIIPLLLMAALCFRRGWLMLIFLALLLPPKTAAAFSWKDLWQRPSQQAAKAFQAKDFAQTLKVSKDPDWQAAALYRTGKFKEAASALEASKSSRSCYNRGNALAHAGKLKKALSAYDQALALDPEMADASFNRDLVKKLLEQQKQQQKPDDKQKSNDQQKADDKQKSKSNKQQDAKKDGSQSQKSKEQQKSDQQQKSKSEQNSENQKNDQQNSSQSKSEKNQQQQQQQQQQKEQQEQEKQDQAAAKNKPQNKPEDKSPEKAAAATQKSDKKPQDKSQAPAAAAEEKDQALDAKQQALKQWLRRVPDDPGGLLERKFLYQYRDRRHRSQGRKEW